MNTKRELRHGIAAVYNAIGERGKPMGDFLKALDSVLTMNSTFNLNYQFDAADGRSLFAHAALHGRIDIMNVLIAFGVPIDINIATPLFVRRPGRNELIPTKYGGYTPLHYAAMNGKAGAVAWLLDHGVTPFATMKPTEMKPTEMKPTEMVLEENEGITPPTPLRLALPHPNTLSVLLTAIGPIDLSTELCEAVYEAYAGSVTVLLEQPDIDVNIACDENGSTPLYNAGRVAYYAARNNDLALREKAEAIFELLAKAGAKVSTVVKDDHITPKDENTMTIEEHARKGHFTPACVRAIAEPKRANTHNRRRHMLLTRRRPVMSARNARNASTRNANTRKNKRPSRNTK